jgi:uncharacterized Zn-finger protein
MFMSSELGISDYIGTTPIEARFKFPVEYIFHSYIRSSEPVHTLQGPQEYTFASTDFYTYDGSGTKTFTVNSVTGDSTGAT